jgi:hypothetical protein
MYENRVGHEGEHYTTATDGGGTEFVTESSNSERLDCFIKFEIIAVIEYMSVSARII